MHIAIFDCLAESIQGRTLPDMFRSLIERGFDDKKERFDPSCMPISYEIYNCIAEEFPTCFTEIDAIIVTGAPNSAYDADAWIKKMHCVLRDGYNHHPKVKLFGVCFGHQTMASALLGDRGVLAEKNPKGWEIGVQRVDCAPEFLNHFPRFTNGDVTVQRSLQFIHQDHVVVPDGSLPPGWVIMGKNDMCEVQGLFQPNRVLTYQGHAEFDRHIAKAVLDMLDNPAWSGDDWQAADRIDNADYFAGLLVEFLLG
ncbi:class I glutamine amidotransferase-like protein [Aspergillus bertholletiae]|uniref:Class I glutamine amidotransferase-like protein n=1 Tax=Aspergillus bertholletiae TaxID=1226010 RepID=A0A5N7BLT2_9EURO|nr:class I glutamine amidotransferase-like protein [Aspergillus bertholletiae]